MANTISLNWDNAPPAQGGGMGDHVPPGGYQLRVSKVRTTDTNTGKKMIIAEYVITGPEQQGKHINDNFVMPRPGTDDSWFPMQRFHQLLVCLGGQQLSGQQDLDLDRMIGLEFVAEIRDDKIPARGNYAEQVISRCNAYYRVGSEEANDLLRQPRAGGAVAAAPAPAVAAVPDSLSVPVPPAAPPTPLSASDDLAKELNALMS